MSKLGDILDKLKAHLVALKNDEADSLLNQVFIEVVTKGQTPYAEIIMGGGEPTPDKMDVNGVVDVTQELIIRVHTHTKEDAIEIWEDLLVLWFNQAKFQELNDLDVLQIYPISSEPPIIFQSEKTVLFHMSWFIEIRYTY